MKQLFRIVFILILLLSLSGCYKADFNVEVLENGNTKVECIVLVKDSDRQYLDSNDIPLNDLQKSMGKDCGVEDITKNIDGYWYSGRKFSQSYVSPNDMFSVENPNPVFGGFEVKAQRKFGKKLFTTSATILPTFTKDSKLAHGEAQLNIKVPGEIIKTNAEIISDSTVQLNLRDIYMEKEISILSEQATNDATILKWVLLLIITVIAVIFLFLRYHKKHNSEK
ncbi:hypothetical protein EDD70_0524 [Hydrogenoanaerobacterium saccharovorans]|uniref:Lipoprotein n=1 Tax=Hydrogenoanaerobacterium saccharovorans TaxID=474960 RepID=A0A1H8AVK7_9FIRM|nr:hypothetical protein [Hydrogenoanaerobacterium saccharovorans]RPF47725.1 hypothetical protein EDD70_0524 [Hydrogenoanaerobacterium saccharovorans]SEM74715.1 hypothetical protein SAMN05216180_1567 [Hydrogenoanaerobacterium saccharovorans]